MDYCVNVSMLQVEIAYSMHNIAELYFARSRYGKAKSLYKQSMRMLEIVLGEDHIKVRNNLQYHSSLTYVLSRWPYQWQASQRSITSLASTNKVILHCHTYRNPAKPCSLHSQTAVSEGLSSTGEDARQEPSQLRCIA